MTASKRDPLLTSARWLVIFCQALAAVVAGSVVLAAGFVLAFHDQVLVKLGEHAPGAQGWEVLAAICLILALVAAMAAMAFLWLREMRRIIDSVAGGDPFVPENADRLQKMGWLTVAIELTAIPVGGIGAWITTVVEDATSDFGISPGGVLLAIVLFILARVFREGTAMRSELEGTV
ncbi:DUF2975 domain-containing protein [Novosphingobium sp.]|jgi:hypothetical protein|uniref:DUF2975 domain-containing protein n=1 Tax=Novosphingobium sp. TaxID=1874826 RepID=UPI001EB45776|nr:DUF2975 domain-containing protein [Novosphingobium sp.]MBK6800084.1 DUF2975 domain-containing protein [Novosphingobium sp.]MBK9010900.1 DUF2975 domain-containing protein [Novosphingobium sp.]